MLLATAPAVVALQHFDSQNVADPGEYWSTPRDGAVACTRAPEGSKPHAYMTPMDAHTHSQHLELVGACVALDEVLSLLGRQTPSSTSKGRSRVPAGVMDGWPRWL
jgi:hypothetical protein